MDHETLAGAEERVAEARANLYQSTAALEDRVSGTVQTATQAVDETKDLVRSTVTEISEGARKLIDQTITQVQEAFDVSSRVRTHPWQSVACSLAAGFVASYTLHRLAAKGEGVRPLSTLLDMLSKEVVNLGETAITTASKTLKNTVQTLVDDAVSTTTTPRRSTPLPQNGNGRHAMA